MIARKEIYSSRSILLTDKGNVDAALNAFFKSIGFSSATVKGEAETEDFVERDVP